MLHTRLPEILLRKHSTPELSYWEVQCVLRIHGQDTPGPGTLKLRDKVRETKGPPGKRAGRQVTLGYFWNLALDSKEASTEEVI